MNIIFVGHRNPQFQTITEYIEQAFQASGHEVRFLEYRDYLLPGRLVHRLRSAEKLEGWRLGGRLKRLSEEFRPDLLFVNYGGGLPVSVVRAIGGATGACTVLWFADYPGNTTYQQRALQIAPHYDLVAAQGRDMVAALQKYGGVSVSWLPAAVDPSVYYPEENPEKRGVRFTGSWYRRREELIRALQGSPLVISGPGWKQASPINTAVITSSGQRPEACRHHFNTAEISLNISLMKPWGEVPFSQVSPRVFEILACGGFLVSDRPADMLELFTDGTHFAGFDGPGDLREVTRYYLDHPSEAETIARQGLAHVLAHHTWDHRVRQLMQLIEERI
ncbi:glycosyltransferase [Candidatus Zixiibacteriota bacterium]